MQATQAVKIKLKNSKFKDRFREIQISRNQVQIDRKIVYCIQIDGKICAHFIQIKKIVLFGTYKYHTINLIQSIFFILGKTQMKIYPSLMKLTSASGLKYP